MAVQPPSIRRARRLSGPSRPLRRGVLAFVVSAALLATGLVVGLGQPASADPTFAQQDAITPVVSYNFDSDSGSSVTDSSGSGNNGTWAGTPSYVAGVSGRAISVSAGANYVKLPLVTGQTDASSSFSYEFWLDELSSTSDSPVFSNQNFVHCYDPGATLYNTSSSGILQGCFGQNGTSTTQHYQKGVSASSVKNTWHYVSAVYDRTAGTVTFYLDGVQTSASTAGELSSAFNLDSGYAFNLGGESGTTTDSGDGYVNAYVDDFSFYDAAIPASQVAADYAATTPATHFAVTTTTNGHGTATSTPLAPTAGATVTLTSKPAAGYSFSGWTVVSPSTLTINPDGTFTDPGVPVTVEANFTLKNDLTFDPTDPISPVVAYNFDGDSGTTVSDDSGSGNDGTWSGTPSYATGVSGKAAYVNSPSGSTSGVNFFKLPLVAGQTDASSSFSYEFWMDELSSSSDSPIVSNQNFTHCYDQGTTLYNTAGSPGTLRACYGQNGTSTSQNYLANVSTSDVRNTWHHVAVVVDRTAGTMTTYLDGVQTAQSTSLSSAFTLKSGFAFAVGADGSGKDTANDGFVDAYIDDFNFFDAAIPASQVDADFVATNPDPAHYTVAFNGNGADGGSTASESFTAGKAQALTTNGYTRAGYAFEGWSTTPTGSATYTDGQTVNGLSSTDGATVTLYAVWNRYRASGDTVAPLVSYDFDKDKNGVVTDSSGNSDNGTWTGTPQYGTGLGGTGKAIRVSDGANFVQLPLLNGKTDGSGSFSFVFWLGQESNTGDAWVFTNIDGGTCNLAGLGLYNISAGVLQACFGQTVGGTKEYQALGGTQIDSAWHQVAGVVNRSTETVTWYLDGTAVATSAAGALTSSSNLVSGDPFTIGQNGSGSYTYNDDAWVDDFDFYNSAISAAQIQNDYNATKPASTTLPSDSDTTTGTSIGTTVPSGFITDTLHAPQTRVGDTVSQPVSGLWNGSTPTSYTKVSGDSWLSVGSNGVVTGTAPASVPQHPGSITVKATDGSTTSSLTVEVPVLGADDAPQLATATWNLWGAGANVDDSLLKDLTVIANNGLDVIGVQQDGGTVAQQLAQGLGWYDYEGAQGVGIVSAYPLSSSGVVDATSTAPAVGVTANVLGDAVRVWDTSLDGSGYGPANACTNGVTDASALVSAEKSTQRYAQAQAVAAEVTSDVQTADATPVILLGDLQSPSAADWTAATASENCGVGAVDWPVPDQFTAAGLTDTFRAANPDPTTDAGDTWSLFDTSVPQERVDYVYSAGSELAVLGSNTLVAGWPEANDTAGNAWTSDHAAVVTTFRIGAPTAAQPAPTVTVTTNTVAYQVGTSAPSGSDLLAAVGASATDGATLAVDDSDVDFTTAGTYTAQVTATDPSDGYTSDPVSIAVEVVPVITIALGETSAAFTLSAGQSLDPSAVLDALEPSTGGVGTVSIDLSQVNDAVTGTYPVVVTATDSSGFDASANATVSITVPTAISVTDDGHGTASATPTTALPGASVELDETPATGYHFDTWAPVSPAGLDIEQESDGVYSFVMPDSGAVSAEATFAPNTYSVAFDANGGSGAAAPETLIYDAPAALTDNGFTLAGYAFQGWATSPSGPVAYADGATVKNLSSDAGATVTLYAVWAPITYTVHFDANGGSGATPDQSFTYGTAQQLTADRFTRTGYTFAGWATTAGGGVVYSDQQSVSELTQTGGATVTLYAVWNLVTYQLSYDLGGGTLSGSNPATYTVTDEPITLTNPTRYAYTFAGWTGTGLTGPTTTVTIPAGATGDRSYVATWVQAAPTWSASMAYATAGTKVFYQGKLYVSAYWTQNQKPGDPNGPWEEVGAPTVTAQGTAAAWTASWIYNGGETVAYGGALYKASYYTRDQTPGDPNGPWEQIGAPVVTSQGTFDSWTASWIYNGGETVAYKGHLYKAQYYTRDQAPGGSNGPWKDLGAY
ncbi:InlB B-repeat-containing protein [Gryllotalpicola reticulitermitis]|uniref:InlB B-repeat-containing protein n=1 Tax=Gryllotalpicola reticulitermitis TaxID=1184153 RepID=A0ABV8Q6C7_9MICO